MRTADPQKNKIGLREIASAAQVSVATVSRVLNGNNRVDPAIRKAVLESAEHLHIDVSQRNKTKALAFLLGNRAPLHVYHSRILTGAEDFCSAHGWDILFLSYNYSFNAPWKELHLPKAVQRHDVVRAVILAGTNSSNLIELLDHKGIPSVVQGNNVVDKLREFKNNDVIFSDDIQGGLEITRYLIGLGHRNIWFVGNTRFPWFARCFQGYCSAMKIANLEPRQSNIDSEDDVEVGYLGTKSLLSRDQGVTAIFAGNDAAACGVYNALRDKGLRIPDDISVAGCDDTFGQLLYPGLTTIREFPVQLGKKMVEMILDRLATPDQPPQSVTFPVEFVRRDSCRPLNSRQDASHETSANLNLQ